MKSVEKECNTCKNHENSDNGKGKIERMQRKIKVLLADAVKEFQEAVALEIGKTADLELVGTSGDAREVLRLAMMHQPDVIVMDLMLKSQTALTTLAFLNQMGIKPGCIIVSAIKDQVHIDRAASLGARCFIGKPFPICELIEVIYGISAVKMHGQGTVNGKSWEDKTYEWVTHALNAIEIPNHVYGYRYVRDAVIFAAADMKLLDKITEDLYPKVALHHETAWKNVERCIRSAIDGAWDNRNVEACFRYLPPTIANKSGKPRNGEFIAALVESLRLEQNNWKEEVKEKTREMIVL